MLHQNTIQNVQFKYEIFLLPIISKCCTRITFFFIFVAIIFYYFESLERRQLKFIRQRNIGNFYLQFENGILHKN